MYLKALTACFEAQGVHLIFKALTRLKHKRCVSELVHLKFTGF